MPYFRSYKNDKGNYISARPSDTGNITYQVTPEAEDFIKKLGYTAGDKLPWGIINPLRAAELIYTHGQGTGTDTGDAPELDPSELATMSADEAEKLMSYLQSRGDVPDEIYDQLRETIEENQKDKVEKLADALDSKTCSSISVWQTKGTKVDGDVRINIWNKDSDYWSGCLHTITLVIDESANDECDYYIIKWGTSIPHQDNPDIGTMTAVNDSQLDMMRVLRSLDAQSFSPADEFKSRVLY
jgi:hypothetical protein